MIGVLLVNLGTPDSPNTPDVRKYLREFLMDERVLDIPLWNRWPLVNLIIAPFRSPKSAKVYKELWTPEGSPLKIYGESNTKALQERLGSGYVVKLAMRYQSPSIKKAIDEFETLKVKKLIVIPLFPQYASASTGSVYQEVAKQMSSWLTFPKLSVIDYFYDHPLLAQGFAEKAQLHLSKKKYDHVVFSYHGLPERQLHKAHFGKTCVEENCDHTITQSNHACYRAQCFATTRLLVEKLGLKEGEYTTCFQSRLGRAEWIKPYTDVVIPDLAAKGVKRVLAFSPAFISDCLETTIEVGEEYKELFLEHGGEEWDLVESLNDSETWISLLENLVKEN